MTDIRVAMPVALAVAVLLLAALGARAEEPVDDHAAAPSGAYYPTGIEPPEMAKRALLAVSLVKFVLLLVFAGLVFCVADWAFLDTRFVNTSQGLWGTVVLGGGLAGLAAAVLIPFFAVGLPLGLILFGGAAAVYANHRNALVTPPLKVLTRAHVDRVKRRLSRRPAPDDGTGPVVGAGRDIVFVGFDDLPVRLPGGSPAQGRANAEVERVLCDAIGRGAVAMGVTARPQKVEIRLRTEGEMTPAEDVGRPAADHFIRTLKHLAGLDPNETRRPQEGRVRAVVDGETYELRIKAAGTVRGEQVAIRILDVATAQKRLEDLGLPEDLLGALTEALAKRPGLVLLSSPRRSGLTTTLHACLRHFDRYVNNVMCFEARVDTEIENVTHIPVDQEDGPVAAAEVRSRSRMEPDVIAIDSLYLAEVAQVLAETLSRNTVIVGVRAADSVQAMTRLGALFGSTAPLAAHLQVVVNQRVLRLLCPECGEAYRPNPEFLRKANLGSRKVDVLYRPPSRPLVRDGKVVVCRRCRNRRYIGRAGLFEVMPVDDEARSLIERGASPADLRTHARKLGMRNLQEEGLRLVIDGRTSIEEVLRAIKQET